MPAELRTPFTVYATLDAGIMYNTNGAAWNQAFVNGNQGLISKQSHGVKWLWSPNNINQSVIDIKVSQPIAYGWSLVGTVEAGFDPFSGYLANSQRSQAINNGKALVLQSANGNSSRAGQWDNSQGFVGVSNKTYGTLVFGRVNSLALDPLIAYDAMGAAYSFSPFGFTGAYAGFSDTELARSNTAFKYRVDFMNFRAAGLAQVGGYDQGNGSSQMWQGQLGGDVNNLFGGTLSLDGVASYAKDGVNTSIFNGTCSVLTKGPFAGQTGCTDAIPMFYNADDLKATLSNAASWWRPNTNGARGSSMAAGSISDRRTRATTIRTASRPSAATMSPATSSTTRNFLRFGSPPTLTTSTGSKTSSGLARNTRSTTGSI